MKKEDPILKSLLAQVKELPTTPGIYQFLNTKKEIIYVGKAKNLRNRVKSYFSQSVESGKTKLLVSKIEFLAYFVVETEEDALILENNLIKELQPIYNINLKDDKTYPFICIKNEPFPKIYATRKKIADGSDYYGPYTNLKAMNTLLKLIREIYPIRSCTHDLSAKNIAVGKFTVCLKYHLKLCLAPCVAQQTETDYNENIKQIKSLLKGNLTEVVKNLSLNMQEHANKLQFEEAERLKTRIIALSAYRQKSIISTQLNQDLDVYSYLEDGKNAYINYLHLIKGAITFTHTFELTKKLDETKEELLLFGIVEMRKRYNSTTKQLIIPFELEIPIQGVVGLVPKIGDKKTLLELSERNVKQYKIEKLNQQEALNNSHRMTRILKTLEKELHLTKLPIHIECFDNSNTSGTNPVSACVVFKMGTPAKKEYRHFNVKTVEGPDDYHTMEEVILRRYTRVLAENGPLPQLIIVDGGKGQISSAQKSLATLELTTKIALIGIAEKLEEIYFPNDPHPLYLDRNSESLKLIQHLRNEAHRFGLVAHQLRRSKAQTHSILDDIKGITENDIQKLIKHYKTVKAIKAAPLESLTNLLTSRKASLITAALSKTKNTTETREQ